MADKYDAVLDDLFDKTVTSASRSWYDTLDPEPRAFIDLVAERARQANTLPNINATLRVLEQEWGMAPSANTLRKHIDRVRKGES